MPLLRFSNVLSWIAFSLAGIYILLTILLLVEVLYKTYDFKVNGEILTINDIKNSKNLQDAGALPGDRYLEVNNKGTLIRVSKKPIPKDLPKDYFLAYEDVEKNTLYPYSRIPKDLLGLNAHIGAAIIVIIYLFNYIFTGSIRLLPWRKLKQETN